jgi:hypothetical protein
MNILRTTAAMTFAALLTAACVPATEELNPGGAVGFDLVPSATSQGEPFTTSDGFTLTVERAVLAMDITLNTSSQKNLSSVNSREDAVWDTRTQALIFLRALPIGQVFVSYRLSSISSYDLGDTREAGYRATSRDLSSFTKADLDRIRSWIANSRNTSNISSGRIVVSAKKGGQSWTLDVVLPAWFKAGSDTDGPEISFNVKQDALERRTVTVMLENLFRRANMDTTLRFQAFVDADLNRDGTIDEAELSKAPTPDGEKDVMRGTINSKVYETLRGRMSKLLVLAPLD